jgi:hypothetical protein
MNKCLAAIDAKKQVSNRYCPQNEKLRAEALKKG